MTFLEAAVLGIVQGFTEFLPISSTAHLRIVPALLGWSDPGAAFSAVIQLGTLLAVLVFFRDDLWGMARSALAAIPNPERRRDLHARLGAYLVIGTVPVVLAGVLAKNAIRGDLRALSVIAATLIIVAVALAIVERVAKHRRAIEDMVLGDAVMIGCAQALALVPGVSRSGITILAALALGFRRDAAARFSFLLSIPAIAGAGLFEMKHLLHGGGSPLPLAVGLLTSAVTGYAAIAWLLRFLRTRTMTPFIVYRIALGLLILALLAAGRIA